MSQAYIYLTHFFIFIFAEYCAGQWFSTETYLGGPFSLVRDQNQVFSEQYVRYYGKVTGDMAMLKEVLNLYLVFKKVAIIQHLFHHMKSVCESIKFVSQSYMTGPGCQGFCL